MRCPILILLTLGCLHVAAAERELVCYSDAFAPYVIPTAAEPTGIDIDALNLVANRIGIRLIVRLMPWKRLEQEIQRGGSSAADCAFAFSRTAERERYLVFGSAPLHVTSYTLFVRGNDAERLKSLGDLTGHAIGVRRGFRLPDSLKAAAASGQVTLDEVGEDEANFRKLINGRVDAVLTNLDVGRYTLKQLKMNDVVPQSESLSLLPTYLAFVRGKGIDSLMPLFDRELNRLMQDGSYQKIVDHYQ